MRRPIVTRRRPGRIAEKAAPVLGWFGTAVLAVSTGAGVARPDSLLGLVPLALLLAVCTALAVTAPRVVLPVVISAPFVQDRLVSTLTPALFVVTVVGCIASWPRASSGQRRAALLMAGMAGWSLFTGVVLNDRGDSTIQMAIAITYSCCVAAFVALGVDPGGRVLMATLGGWGFLVAVAIHANPAIAVDRSTSVWGENANGAAFVVVVGAVSLFCLSEGRRARILPAGLMIIYMMSAALATGSRGALVAGMCAVAFRLFRRVMLSSAARSVGAALLGVVLMLVLAAPAMAWLIARSGRDAAGSEGNVVSRQGALFAALRVARSNPFDGVGLGNLGQHDALGLRAHNVVAGMAAEAGFPLALLFVGLLVVAFFRGRNVPGSLPLLACVVAASISLEWWGASRTGVIALTVLGFALSGDRNQNRDEPSYVNSSVKSVAATAQPVAARPPQMLR